jgi:RNA-directed DNA polymerase
LEPIFEADFEDCSYGFRLRRSAHEALQAIQQALKEGCKAIYDADLKGYFDSIPQDKLMACVEMRVADRSVLKLIRMWLKAPIVEEKDGKRKPPVSNDKGTPQGGVISPLLSNLYLHWFDTLFHRKGGPAEWANARLIRYADDFVVMARYQGDRLKGWIEGKLENWLELEINEHLRGWKNYFRIGYCRREFRKHNHYVRRKLLAHLQRRSQRGHKIPEGISTYRYLEQLGLVEL